MSDDKTSSTTAPVPDPTPAPAERVIENPMLSWMRGGTVSSAYQQQLDQQKHEAEKARAVEDAKRNFAEAGHAKQHKMVTGGNKQHAGIVLELRHPKDRTTVLDYIECELHVLPDNSLMLQMCCPDCYQRAGITANFHVRQSNRKFELNTKRAGEIWVNPKNPSHIVTLAGTINLTDRVKCPNLGCEKTFVIDESVLRYV